MGPKFTLIDAEFEPAAAPDRLTVWVPSASTMVKVPLTEPLAGGVKVTLMVQLLLAATLEPQLLVSLKLLDPAVMPMLVMEAAEDPELLRVTDCWVLEDEKLRLPVETETLVPVPVKLTV